MRMFRAVLGLSITVAAFANAGCNTIVPLPSKHSTASSSAQPSDGGSGGEGGEGGAGPGVVTSVATTSTGPACSAGSQQCVGSNSLKTCTNGAWSTKGCAALCAAAGYASSNGCSYDSDKQTDICECNSATSTSTTGGNECTSGEQTCNGSNAENWCSNGTWQTANCTDVCIGAGYAASDGCKLDTSTQQDNCFCSNGTTSTSSTTSTSTTSGGGGVCSYDSQCPGECDGDDVVCCPSCKHAGTASSYCGQVCCDLYGDCF